MLLNYFPVLLFVFSISSLFYILFLFFSCSCFFFFFFSLLLHSLFLSISFNYHTNHPSPSLYIPSSLHLPSAFFLPPSRRLLTEDKREKYYRAEVQNKVYRREMLKLDQELHKLHQRVEAPGSLTSSTGSLAKQVGRE